LHAARRSIAIAKSDDGKGVAFTGVDGAVSIDVDIGFGVDTAPEYCSSRM
jgi:hypothetical protein